MKVSPWKGVFRFGQRGKLKPRYIGPFEILDRIGPVAYRLALPPTYQVHNVFHVSLLRKYLPDPSHVINYADIEIQVDATSSEEPVRIMERREKYLRNKIIPLVKILWSKQGTEVMTWETEDDMKSRYPHLFEI